MSLKTPFAIFSDGGSVQGQAGSCACIVEDRKRGIQVKLVAYLGESTNNEAEISAVLLGLSLLRARIENLSGEQVKLIADSEYTLKSATEYIVNWQKNGWRTAKREPVKNQGLWRTFLYLSDGLEICTEHVRGHTGHPENEACDTACNWIRSESEYLSESKPVKLEISDGLNDNAWWGISAAKTLADLRAESPKEPAMLAWTNLFKKTKE